MRNHDLMSVGSEFAESFFAPLKGKATTFRVVDRRSNRALATLLIESSAATGRKATVLDNDALYASESASIGPPKEARASVYVQEVGERADGPTALVLAEKSDLLIVDGLNTLFHSFAWSSRKTASRKLALTVAMASFLARTNGTIAALTIYDRVRQSQGGKGRRLSDFGDATVSLNLKQDELSFRCERGNLWPGGSLVFPIPSGWRGISP
jgi:hypothetical protein